ncbi:MAG: porin [Syntrophobacteraceae bacterium]
MKCFLKLGQKVIFKALTVTMLLGAFMVFMGGWACAEEKSVAEKILDIMLENHQISQEQYDALLEQAEAEKLAVAQQIAEAQKAATAKEAAARGIPEEKAPNFTVWWYNGLRFTTEDNNFNLHIGGRGEIDFADAEPDSVLTRWSQGKYSKTSFSEPKIDGYGDQLRRVRFDFDGTIYKDIEFMTQVDFAPSYSTTTVLKSATLSKGTLTTTSTSLSTGSALSYADVWAGVKDIPYIGRLRVGQMEEPFSLEELIRDNFRTFMESGLPFAFVPRRNTGLQVMNSSCDGRVAWSLGYFFQQQVATSSNGVALDTTGDLFSPHLDATQFAGRLTGLPWYEANGEKLLHIGVSYTHLFRSDSSSSSNAGTLDFKSAPEANLFSPLVDTGNFLAQGVDLVDPEIALEYGPFSAQAEYVFASANNVTDTTGKFIALDHDANFYGWYAYATYFITGENRPYNKTPSPTTYQATFGRVIPYHNFSFAEGGYGAWEVAFRVSQLNTTDHTAGFNGGLETDYTAAVNWYLNPYVEMKMNYIHADVGQHSGYGNLLTSGSDNIYETRFQIAF